MKKGTNARRVPAEECLSGNQAEEKGEEASRYGEGKEENASQGW